MRALVWLAAVAAFAFWSLLAWIAYGIVGLIFALFGSGLGALLGAWAAWLADGIGDLGQVLIVIAWLIGSLVIFGVPRVFGGSRTVRFSGSELRMERYPAIRRP